MCLRRSRLAAQFGLPVLAACLLVVSAARADDWPGWRGPNRDGLCQEKNLLRKWPSEGPKLLWRVNRCGQGFSTPSVAGDVLYVMGDGNGREWVVALNWRRQGEQVWASALGPVRHTGSGHAGPRSTPTVDGDRVFALGINGDLVCFNTADGNIVWRKDLVRDFGGAIPQWGYSESVLIDGNLVLCTPGGPRATIVALNKSDGRTVWASPIGDPAGYSSIIKATFAQVPQYVTLTNKGVVGVAAKDGRLLWRYDRPSNGTANIPTCVTLGQTVFGATGYGTGGGLAHIKRTGQKFDATELYFSKQMKNHHGGLVLADGALYGCDDPGMLTCMDYKTGNVAWRDRTAGKCSVVWADGLLFCRDEKGPITLVEATTEGFRQRGRFDQPQRSDKPAWPHPVIANGMLFIRDQGALFCYDVRAPRM